MEYFAAIDVSLELSSVCVVDSTGQIVREAKVASEPEVLVRLFRESGLTYTRIGLEAGPLSQWLHAGLTAAGFEVILLETRHVKAALGAMTMKTDRNDARGMAQMIRMGWFRPVHAKTVPAQEMRALLVARKQLQARLNDLELCLRGILRGFGLKLGDVGKSQFEPRVRELVVGHTTLEGLAEPMLRARAALRVEYAASHREVLRIVRTDAVCRRLMTVPGVGAIVAMTFKAAIDDPSRFKHSPKRYQSGEIDRSGHISKTGDGQVRTALFEAAHVMLLRAQRFSAPKAWALRVARTRGLKRAKVALARKLSVVLHRMWADGTEFRWGREVNEGV
jgi:transposase